MSDQDLKDLVYSLAVESKNISKEADKRNKEADKRNKEADKRNKEADKRNKELNEKIDKMQEETKKLSKYIGNIGQNQGDIAEEFFINSISPTLKVANIQYDELYKNMYKKTKMAQGEFDIVLINGKDIAIIETKYKAHLSDLDNLINKKYTNFKKLYPQYNNYNHHLGLASFHINESLRDEALSKNVFLLQRKGDLVETITP